MHYHRRIILKGQSENSHTNPKHMIDQDHTQEVPFDKTLN